MPLEWVTFSTQLVYKWDGISGEFLSWGVQWCHDFNDLILEWATWLTHEVTYCQVIVLVMRYFHEMQSQNEGTWFLVLSYISCLLWYMTVGDVEAQRQPSTSTSTPPSLSFIGIGLKDPVLSPKSLDRGLDCAWVYDIVFWDCPLPSLWYLRSSRTQHPVLWTWDRKKLKGVVGPTWISWLSFQIQHHTRTRLTLSQTYIMLHIKNKNFNFSFPNRNKFLSFGKHCLEAIQESISVF